MFSEKFDSLMNIAEVSNSLLGREVNMNPSYIGRLRSGARPLPKKHTYMTEICRYLAGHIRKEYQINALQKLCGIGGNALSSQEGTALYLEQWLLRQEHDPSTAAGRLISGFSRPVSKPAGFQTDDGIGELPQKYAAYLYGNAGKRKAVEQFFSMVLQQEEPRTLYLFSDENMAWLYEDAAFAKRWAELFIKVIQKGNRVKIIHTLSRDLNEMLEAVTKWIPVYMTGMVEPYCYPRLRDGIFQRTLFIAPDTAAVVSSSVQQDTGGMLNMFITDRAALTALKAEYDRYFSLCRPMMRIFTERDAEGVQKAADTMIEAEGDAYLCMNMPPLFAMPEKMVTELSQQSGDTAMISQWERSAEIFKKTIKKQHLTLVLRDPQYALLLLDTLRPFTGNLFSACGISYTKEQYGAHMEYLRQMEEKYENLTVRFIRDSVENTVLYVKENTGVIMAKPDTPQTVFVISERNMVSAFWDYIGNCLLI